MLNHESCFSFGDLSAAGVSVRPLEAVTIVRGLVLRVARGELPGVPSAHVIRLFASGTVSVEGPIAAGSGAVVRAAHLLETLLPPFNAPADLHAPGALRLVLGRALGTLDLPGYESLDSFAQALSRFASDDPEGTVRSLVARVARPTTVRRVPAATPPGSAEVHDLAVHQREGAGRRRDFRMKPSPLTISDIRRARRATGLTLAEISERSHIPKRLIRELEWGYLRNWPGSQAGRRQLVRYAHAAGLDDELVVRTAWPLLVESVGEREALVVETIPLDPAVDIPQSTALARIAPAAGGARRRTRSGLAAAVAIPVLLAISVGPALWERAVSHGSVSPVASAPAASAPGSIQSSISVESTPVESTSGPEVRIAAASAPTAIDGPLEPRPASGISDGPAYSPTFDSVGSAMFYHAESGDHSALMRAETDSRGVILSITSIVDDRAHNFHARPSPDGARIAFDSDRDGERAVYVADADGRGVQRISGEGFAAVPSWSPDGRTIAFVRAEPDPPGAARRPAIDGVWNLWTADLATGAMRRLTSYRVGQPWGGSWFPDGRRIAYSHEKRLVVLDLASGNERVYRSPVKGRLVRTPAVSPDGTRVMFQVYRDGAWILELRDGSMRKVLSDPSAEEYTWSPDGRRVAYHSRSAGKWGVWVMAAR